MNYNFFDNLLKKIVNFYYKLMLFNADSLKDSGEMPITIEEHKINMAVFKNAASACNNCFR
jgi:hypothetical protein